MTFCWLPPERLRMSWRAEGVRMRRRSDLVGDVFALPVLADDDAADRVVAAGADVAVLDEVAHGDDPLLLAIFGAEHDPGADGVARPANLHRRAHHRHAPGGGADVAEDELEQFGTAGADEAEDAKDFAAGDAERRGFREAGAFQSCPRQARGRRFRAAASRRRRRCRGRPCA
jgi:hypothetical protein